MSNESNFFTRLAYEASPLNRVLKSSAPGNSWSGSNRGQQVITRPNRADEDVKIFRYTWPAAPKPTHEGTFGAGQLLVEEVTDEDGNKQLTYADRTGLKVLHRVQVGTNEWLNTYYIYDLKRQLRYVLPPEGFNRLAAQGWDIESTEIQKFYFRYLYDGLGRVIEKTVPGGGTIYMVYDQRDRLVFRQDESMKGQYWIVFKYDAMDRLLVEGKFETNASRVSLQTNQNNLPTYANTVQVHELLIQNYYDSYEIEGITHTFNTSFSHHFIQAPTPSQQRHGMLTGKRVRVLGTNSFIVEVSFYD
ncbi:hypothetical protein A3SI_20342, partial [Nitritalea halalkaliphila LW7]